MNLALMAPLIIVASALVMVLLERLRPYDKGQKLFRPGFFVDLLGYGLVQSYLLGLAINAFVAWLCQTSWLTGHWGVSSWPLVAQVAFFFVTHDFYIYCFHRLQHRSSLLWRIHEAHHSGDDVDWLSGTRSHAFEILINQTVEFAPIALLGAAPEVAIIKATIDAVWGMYIHSNIDVRSGRLQWVLNGPEMHRWHHARELARRNANFGTKLALWDMLFKTAYLPGQKPKGYGLADAPGYPSGLPGAEPGGIPHHARRQLVIATSRPGRDRASARA